MSIASVERDTGLGKDTLRVWERRYGFPRPERDALGERLYPADQVEKLRVIRRLLDAGHRPGKLVALDIAELARLAGASAPAPAMSASAADPGTQVELIRSHDGMALRGHLTRLAASLGLARFVTEVVAPLNVAVGDAWMQGRLDIFQEHLYTECVQGVLRQAIGSIADAGALDRPRVLLTTLPGEPHGLGILMAEALLALEGCRCVSLGTQTPLAEIAPAAAAHRVDIVALGFSAAMNPRQVLAGLAELRAALPDAVRIWAGGRAPVLLRRPPAGVRVIATLEQIAPELERWHERARDAA